MFKIWPLFLSLSFSLHLSSSVVIGVGKACDRSGVQANHGDRWEDGCNSCQCMNGNIRCTKVSPTSSLRLCFCTNQIPIAVTFSKNCQVKLKRWKCIKDIILCYHLFVIFIIIYFSLHVDIDTSLRFFYCDHRCIVVISPACCSQTLVSHSAPYVHLDRSV